MEIKRNIIFTGERRKERNEKKSTLDRTFEKRNSIYPFIFLKYHLNYTYITAYLQDLEESEDWESDRKKMELKKPYCLRVYVYQCRNLPAIDNNGLIDPYVKVGSAVLCRAVLYPCAC